MSAGSTSLTVTLPSVTHLRLCLTAMKPVIVADGCSARCRSIAVSTAEAAKLNMQKAHTPTSGLSAHVHALGDEDVFFEDLDVNDSGSDVHNDDLPPLCPGDESADESSPTTRNLTALPARAGRTPARSLTTPGDACAASGLSTVIASCTRKM